ncbi:MAG: radical SAM protein [Lentimicrobiaceae bacterium]|nr:radical SAM protein [Lentimicrobiaceae bacterium]
MNSKLLLVSANRFNIPYPVYPLGISYLATHLKKTFPGLQLRFFDCFNRTNEDLISEITSFQPHYIGVSLRNIDNVNFYESESFISTYRSLFEIIRRHSRAKLIAGGSAFSLFPKKLFQLLQPDFGIVGEGEQSFAKLIECLNLGRDYTTIEGLVYANEYAVTINPRSNFLRCPDLEFESDWLSYYWQHSGMLNIQTKRGCPYHCIYCTYPLIEGSEVRTLDADKIVDTLQWLTNEKNISYVFFTDSVFNISNPFNTILAEKIIQSGIKINWGAYFSPHLLDETLLSLFQRAGLTHVEFGTESLSDKQLENYGKHFTFDEVLEKSELCNRFRVFFCHSMILGGYGETEETLAETFENSKKIKNTVFFPFIGMRIYPGTPLHRIALTEGTLDKNDSLLEPAYYISKNIDLTTLKEKAKNSGRNWIFPDEELSPILSRMRERNKKGPLWHHLRT